MNLHLRKIILVLVFVACWLPCEAKHMAVIVNKGNSTENVSSGDLSKIFQTNTRKWPDGRNITLVVRDLTSSDTQEALQRLYKMTQADVKTFVDQHKGAFVVCDSDEALLKIVESTPGALGLVDVYSITSKVNVVKVDGKLPLEQGYLLH
jgi:ABC-type phosphate transport system substrate-binding protein